MEKMMLPAARSYRTIIRHRRWLTDHTFEMELARPDGFDFIPGQRIHLKFGEIGRDYSLVSSHRDPYLRLCIRHIHRGELTPKLLEIPIGESLQFFGPNGYFLFRASGKHPVFVATGTGIAPFVSMGLAGCRGFTLLHGIRNPEERYYADVFQTAAEMYRPCITGSDPGGSKSFSGRVTEYVAEALPVGEYDFYLCGRTEMIRDMTHIVDRRFPESRIFIELFF